MPCWQALWTSLWEFPGLLARILACTVRGPSAGPVPLKVSLPLGNSELSMNDPGSRTNTGALLLLPALGASQHPKWLHWPTQGHPSWPVAFRVVQSDSCYPHLWPSHTDLAPYPGPTSHLVCSPCWVGDDTSSSVALQLDLNLGYA